MLIELNNVTKIYGDHGMEQVYGAKNISLSLNGGEFIALVGPSGSGKTTLLNMLSGLLSPTSGEISLVSQRIDKMTIEERTRFRLHHLGFIFQDYQLLPMLTARENVELPLRLKNFPMTEIHKQVEWALSEVALSTMTNRYPRELSGGQQQRVSVARALASKPQIILADEPTANLDSKTAQDIIDLFRKLNRELGTTFIFSTHDQRLIDQVDKVIRLKDGEIV